LIGSGEDGLKVLKIIQEYIKNKNDHHKDSHANFGWVVEVQIFLLFYKKFGSELVSAAIDKYIM